MNGRKKRKKEGKEERYNGTKKEKKRGKIGRKRRWKVTGRKKGGRTALKRKE